MKKIIASLVALAAASVAQAAPVKWAGNGHYYEYIGTGLSWTDARAAALASSHLGQSGYLVTITSAGENSFIGTLSSDGWIGATDQAVEGEWRWADGPEGGNLFWTGAAGGTPSGYSSWSGGEPNDYFGFHTENYAQFSGGNWNDLPNGGGYERGYYIEYNGVPEPAAWALMLGGFGLLGAASRRRRSTTVFA